VLYQRVWHNSAGDCVLRARGDRPRVCGGDDAKGCHDMDT